MEPYIQKLLQDQDPFLVNLRAEAQLHHVPIVREDTAALLRFLVKYHKPSCILEAGTAIGFSSILMAKCSENPSLHIDTVEIDPDTAAAARKNIQAAGYSRNIRVILGDAGEVLSCLTGCYDMIFVDSAKSQYLHMYDDLKRLLKPGGLLICDNVIFYGKIFDVPEEAPHKHRTIITNMRNFLETLFQDEDYTSTLLEIGDGVTLSHLKQKKTGDCASGHLR